MSRILIALGVAWPLAAHADVPSGIAQKLVRFVVEGCGYFAASSPPPPKPVPPERKLAAHFGHIVGTSRDGVGIRYTLKTGDFEGWDVSYWEHGVDMKPPATVAITMGDLQPLLGPDNSPDVDYALSMTVGGAKVKVEDREFDMHREDTCRVKVRTEADAKKGPQRRVFSLRVWY